MQLVCKKCGYEWNTKSKAKRISCSKCKTSITLGYTVSNVLPVDAIIAEKKKEEKALIKDSIAHLKDSGRKDATQTLPSNTNTNTNKIIKEVNLPLPLAEQLNKFMLARMIGIARSNGENKLRFKVNEQGELYVLS